MIEAAVWSVAAGLGRVGLCCPISAASAANRSGHPNTTKSGSRTVSSPHPPLMTCEDLALQLNVTVRFVRRLVDERRVPFLKVGKFVRFDPEQIERWLHDPEGREPLSRSRSAGGGRRD